METRKEEITSKADEISSNLNGKSLDSIRQSLDFYSKSSDIKAFVNENVKDNEVPIENNIGIDPSSDNNSLIIEEREITLEDSEKVFVQFVSTTDMKKDAKELSLKFLPFQ